MVIDHMRYVCMSMEDVHSIHRHTHTHGHTNISWLSVDEVFKQAGLGPISPVAEIAARIHVVVLTKERDGSDATVILRQHATSVLRAYLQRGSAHVKHTTGGIQSLQ